jgi:hypothetical protein
MEPRLPSSKQWSKFPAELIQQMKSVFQEGFGAQLGKANIEVEGRIYPAELLLSLGFSRPNQLKQPNFEISLGYDSKKDNVLKLMHSLFDAMGALFDQYFQSDDDSDFPRYWEEIDFEGKKLFIQYSTKNSKLEDEADLLLGQTAGHFMNDEEDESEEELHQIKEKLGLTDEEDETDGED